jgi:cytochrome c-type biogenesis protein CcmE
MHPRTKFLIGGVVILGTAGWLMSGSLKETMVYFLTPEELHARVVADPTIRDIGVKVGAKVVGGSIVRDSSGRQVAFQMTDGKVTYPVVYKGLIPDTFSDSAEVVVEGRLDATGTFQATTLLAKCASRYEAAPEGMPVKGKEAYERLKHPDGVPKTASPASDAKVPPR